MNLVPNMCSEITLLKLLPHLPGTYELAYLPLVLHMSVNQVSIGSDNGLLPIRHQAII